MGGEKGLLTPMAPGDRELQRCRTVCRDVIRQGAGLYTRPHARATRRDRESLDTQRTGDRPQRPQQRLQQAQQRIQQRAQRLPHGVNQRPYRREQRLQ